MAKPDEASAMNSLRLVKVDPAAEEALNRDPDYQAALAAEDWPQLGRIAQDFVARQPPMAEDPADGEAWGGYLAVDPETSEAVGSCGFKTPPDRDGVIEIAYFTYPGFTGRGHATAMARRLIELATRRPEVRRVIAHTQPAENASTSVLRKVGMRFVGEVVDPDDGRVWRWMIGTEA